MMTSLSPLTTDYDGDIPDLSLFGGDLLTLNHDSFELDQICHDTVGNVSGNSSALLTMATLTQLSDVPEDWKQSTLPLLTTTEAQLDLPTPAKNVDACSLTVNGGDSCVIPQEQTANTLITLPTSSPKLSEDTILSVEKLQAPNLSKIYRTGNITPVYSNAIQDVLMTINETYMSGNTVEGHHVLHAVKNDITPYTITNESIDEILNLPPNINDILDINCINPSMNLLDFDLDYLSDETFCNVDINDAPAVNLENISLGISSLPVQSNSALSDSCYQLPEGSSYSMSPSHISSVSTSMFSASPISPSTSPCQQLLEPEPSDHSIYTELRSLLLMCNDDDQSVILISDDENDELTAQRPVRKGRRRTANLVDPYRKNARVNKCKDRKQRKKKQNKEAAIRYRIKKRLEEEEAHEEEDMLEERNVQLKEKVTDIKREMKYLKDLLVDIQLHRRSNNK